MAMSNLAVRVIAACVFVPAFLGLMWLGGPAFYALVMLVTFGASWEYFTITGFRKDRWSFAFAVKIAMIVAVATTLLPLRYLGPALIAAMMAVALWHMLRFGDMPTAVSRAGVMFFGVVYAGVLPTMFWHLRVLPEGRGWVLMVLAIVWLADTGAYFTGRALGRHKMYSAVSPGKSWEGAVGGLASSVGGALLCRALFMPQLPVAEV
ncbi:MAG: phosphatidate cytidylyltransferase, partial [Myxococcota bacterium]